MVAHPPLLSLTCDGRLSSLRCGGGQGNAVAAKPVRVTEFSLYTLMEPEHDI
jgi:hypothetical protein